MPSRAPDGLFCAAPSGKHPVPCPHPASQRPDSRNAGAALLTRVELGRGGQGPGGGQGGLGAQGAGQEGRCATWEEGGQTDTSELAHRSGGLFTCTPPAPTRRQDSRLQAGLWGGTRRERGEWRKEAIWQDPWLRLGKCRKHTGGCLPKPRSKLGVPARCLTQLAEQTAPFVQPRRDDVNGQ